MPTKEQFDELKSQFAEGLDNIAADIERLANQQNSGDLTADQEQEVYDGMLEIANRIRQIAGTTPEPEQPTEPAEPTEPGNEESQG